MVFAADTVQDAEDHPFRSGDPAMAGHRFLRQRRASLRPFEAVQIAEILEARRLLAAVSDDGFIEALQPEAAAAEDVVTENFVVTSEEYTEQCLPEYYPEGEVVIDEELRGEPVSVDSGTEVTVVEDVVEGEILVAEEPHEDVASDKADAETEDFMPILVICEFPEELWSRCPDDGEVKAEDCNVVYETQEVQTLPWFESTGEPATAVEDLPSAGEWDWHIDFSTVRGFEGETEYVAFDGPENSEFNDTLLMENGVTDEGTWTDFVDVSSEVTGDISPDDTFSMEFLPEDPMLWSRDQDLPVGEEFKPQVMLFSSLRGGSGVVLRALALSVPDETPQITSPALLSNFVPEQRRVESVFAGRNVVLGQSGERAADARLVSMRTESRTAIPGISASVVPKRSTLLTGSQSESATPKDAAAVEGRLDLDIFGEWGTTEDKKRSQRRQSQSESREDVPVPQSSESTGTVGARTTPGYVDNGESVTVSVDSEAAAVSGLARKQVPR